MPPRSNRGRKPKSQAGSQDQESQKQSPDPDAQTTAVSENNEEDPASSKRNEGDLCPACPEDGTAAEQIVSKEDWIRCDACKVWFHWRCVGDEQDLEAIDKWFCKSCLTVDPKRTITLKPPARKSTRRKPLHDYATLHAGASIHTESPDWFQTLQKRPTSGDPFRRMEGSELTLEWLNSDENALTEPVVVLKPDGLGMEMPEPDLTVEDVSRIVGPDMPVEVMDVSTQTNTPHYTLAKWAAYYSLPASKRDKIRNVISLEVTDTPLAEKILPPRIVREIDWVEKYWPSSRKGKGHAYPKVQLYCLMSVEKSWTDWHIDFAGSSVYYHILRGSKIFYFIKPTPANLAAYERWSSTELQSSTWLGGLVDNVYKVELSQGNTMLIPTGWIHSVYTPSDSLVFGGNFLHSYNVACQQRVREIEIATHVPKKFRFPYFTKLCWYVADAHLSALKAKEDFSPRILRSLQALASFLVSEARRLERADVNDAARKDAKEQVPGERIKDPAALARELRWRVNLALKGDSGDEADEPGVAGTAGVKNGKNGGAKRKHSNSPDITAREAWEARFRNFKPKTWDAQEATSSSSEITLRNPTGQRPAEGTQWTEHWLRESFRSGSKEATAGGEAKMEVDAAEEEAKVVRTESVLTRVRRTPDGGLERQKIERTVEVWRWD